MIKKLIVCLLLFTLLACILFIKIPRKNYCGFSSKEEHEEVKKWMKHHGILDCYQDNDGRYYFVRRGQRINLIGNGDYAQKKEGIK